MKVHWWCMGTGCRLRKSASGECVWGMEDVREQQSRSFFLIWTWTRPERSRAAEAKALWTLWLEKGMHVAAWGGGLSVWAITGWKKKGMFIQSRSHPIFHDSKNKQRPASLYGQTGLDKHSWKHTRLAPSAHLTAPFSRVTLNNFLNFTVLLMPSIYIDIRCQFSF